MEKLTNLIIDGKNGRPIVFDIYYQPSKESLPVIIFAHGFKGFKNWGPFDLVAEEMANNGFFVVKFNFSFNGGTGENPIDFPDLEAFGNNNYSKEQDDFDSIVSYLLINNEPFKKIYNPQNISLVGHSRGGAGVVLFASRSKFIDRIVTWSAPSNLEKRLEAYNLIEWKKNGVVYIKNSRTNQKMPLFYQFYLDFVANRDKLNLMEATKRIAIPFLVIHGKADETVYIEEARKFKLWNPTVKIFEVNGAGHTFGGTHPANSGVIPVALKEVVDRTISFLKES